MEQPTHAMPPFVTLGAITLIVTHIISNIITFILPFFF